MLGAAQLRRRLSGALPGGTTLASLAEQEFRWYFAGTLAFFMAMQMQFVLRGYLAYELTDSASALGLVAISITLPMLLVAPVAGVIADRVNKKTLLIVSQTLAAVASFAVTALIVGDWIRFWHLLVISVVTGVVFSFNMPTRAAITPLLVPQHKLMNAISLQAGGQNLTRIFAPALGGLLIAPLGAGWVYGLTGLFFIMAVFSELRLPKHGLSTPSRGTNFLQEFREGLSYVTRDRLLGMLVVSGMLLPLFGFPVQQMLPIFAEDVFHQGPTGLGFLAAMSGLGGLAGAMVSANMDGQPAKGKLMFAGGICMAVFTIAFALAPFFGLAMIFLALSNIGQMLFQTTNNTVIQAQAPPELRGRVNSLMLMSFGLMPLGVLPITALADEVGAPTAVASSSTVLLLTLLLLFALLGAFRNLRMDALARTELSPVQAAALVAEGKLSQEEADRLANTGRRDPTRAGAARN
ncbi:MAG TPA: MFS transporter [Dehalococcoidia bacterium]|nr:MFS transporter [Dehalococcoidia bacterium]